jgi:serine/threonine protein kinase
MASVYKVYDESLERHVALKVVHGAFLGDPTFAERFRREAKVVARLEHPHVVPVHAFGVEGGVPWMAMRLITGGAVSSRLALGPLPTRDAVRIVGDVAAALDYAHSKGVVHRDVKPQNMLLDEDERVYLADFGIARLLEASTHLTATGMIQGTPAYMSPEQATGQAVDSRADVYALGIVAYEALTGRVPFSGPTPVSILLKHVSEPVPRPPASELPAPATNVLEKCLAKSPEERFASAMDFVAALDAALVATLPAVPRAARAPAPRPDDRRSIAPALVFVAIAALALLAVAAAGLVWWLSWPRVATPIRAVGVPPTTLQAPPKESAPPASAPVAVATPARIPSPRPSSTPSLAASSAITVPSLPESSGPIRIYCEARPHAEVFGKTKTDDVADSVQDLKKAIAKRSALALTESRDQADVVLQVIERGRSPALVGMRQVRVRLVAGPESVEITGQDSFTGFNTWSGAAGGAVDRVEAWVRANRGRLLKRGRGTDVTAK